MDAMQRALLPTVAVCAALVLASCERTPEPAAPPRSERIFSVEQVTLGARLYQQHCAQCHGPNAQGHPDWQTAGVVAAPPLDSTGNAIKRSRASLLAVIRDGAVRNGAPVMPAWKGRLSDGDIEAVISWFQALWPPEVYDTWRKTAARGT